MVVRGHYGAVVAFGLLYLTMHIKKSIKNHFYIQASSATFLGRVSVPPKLCTVIVWVCNPAGCDQTDCMPYQFSSPKTALPGSVGDRSRV